MINKVLYPQVVLRYQIRISLFPSLNNLPTAFLDIFCGDIIWRLVDVVLHY